MRALRLAARGGFRPASAFAVTLGAGTGFGRTFVAHGQAMSLTTRFAPYLEKPNGGPDWQFRLQFALLFPK